MDKLGLGVVFLVVFCVGSIVGCFSMAMHIMSSKNSGYIEVSGQTYKLVPVTLTYAEKVNEFNGD